jgi:hypothetical protein
MKLKLENKRGSVLRVTVNIWVAKKNAYATSVAIFDTGAYKTIIDERLASFLELPVSVKEGVSTVTATGIAITQGSILPRILLGSTHIKNIPVNIMKLPEELDTRCILGMNILQEYDIHISSFDKIVTLTPKPLPKRYFRDDYSVTLVSVENDGDSKSSTALE